MGIQRGDEKQRRSRKEDKTAGKGEKRASKEEKRAGKKEDRREEENKGKEETMQEGGDWASQDGGGEGGGNLSSPVVRLWEVSIHLDAGVAVFKSFSCLANLWGVNEEQEVKTISMKAQRTTGSKVDGRAIAKERKGRGMIRREGKVRGGARNDRSDVTDL